MVSFSSYNVKLFLPRSHALHGNELIKFYYNFKPILIGGGIIILNSFKER